MLSPKFGVGLLVGSSGNLGPVWSKALKECSHLVLAADFSDPDADFQVDLRNQESLESLIRKLPDLDFLVVNSGLDSKLQGGEANGASFDVQRWREFFEVNVVGAAALIEGVVPKLRPNATVITIGSIYGIVAPRVDVYNEVGSADVFYKHPAYGASKAALLNLTRQYAVRFAGRVSFNMLTLGVVAGNQTEVFIRKMPGQIPSTNFLDREQLGKHLQHLVCHRDLELTGQNLIVDGGYTIW